MRKDHGSIPSQVLTRNWDRMGWDGENFVGNRVTKFNDGKDPRWVVSWMALSEFKSVERPHAQDGRRVIYCTGERGTIS